MSLVVFKIGGFMRNILSYNRSIPFEGKEILAWAHFQVENETSHAKQGKKILALYESTLVPERKYRVFSSFETFGCGEIRYSPLVLKANI